MKLCYKCETHKPVRNFSFRASARDGLSPICKECQALYTKAWRERNAKAIREKKATYYNENKDYVKQKHAEYRAENKEDIAVKKKNWRKANADAIREYGRKYRKANLEAMALYRENWKANNPETYIAIVASDNARRRTLEKDGVSARALSAWIKSTDKICFYCKIPCELNFHVDHFVPLARGGAHALANLRIACPSCNFSKNARDPLEFMGQT